MISYSKEEQIGIIEIRLEDCLTESNRKRT